MTNTSLLLLGVTGNLLLLLGSLVLLRRASGWPAVLLLCGSAFGFCTSVVLAILVTRGTALQGHFMIYVSALGGPLFPIGFIAYALRQKHV